MGVGGQRNALAALRRERDPVPVVLGLDGYAPNRDSIPGPSSPWRVYIPTELSRPLINIL
jgi:hypothetical protein